MKITKLLATILISVCLISDTLSIPCLKANEKDQLICLRGLDKKSLIYSINDAIVCWDNDNVIMYDIVLNHNIQAFSSTDFAKDYKQEKTGTKTLNPLSFVDGQMYQYNSNGLCCYNPKTGKRLWNNIGIIPQRYYQYYNPVVSNNGILYIIKRHDNKNDIVPLLLCVDSKDGKIVKQQNINKDKFNAKYKDIVNMNAQIVAIYNNKLIISRQAIIFIATIPRLQRLNGYPIYFCR